MSTPQGAQATSPRKALDAHDQLPAALGFRMPAEWEPHRATWLVWPHSWHDWETKLPAIHWCYVEIVSRLISGEKVAILVKDATHEARARRKLEQAMVDLSRVEFYTIRTNRSWIRDHGPLFIVGSNGQTAATEERKAIAVTDWRFNSWARYSNWKLDNEVPGRLADLLGVEAIPATRAAERDATASGPGRRQRRRQWARPAPHHGRVLAELDPGSKPGSPARADGGGSRKLPGGSKGALVEPWNCGRRYARPCRRRRPVRRSSNGGCCDRGQSL